MRGLLVFGGGLCFERIGFGGKEGREAQTNFDYKTGATQVLFLQHVMRSLRSGGRCGIVLDEGLLFRTNEDAFVKTKRKLLDDCDLWCVVSLPGGVFTAAGAGVKTNLLFFTKGQPTTDVWYYEHPYPAGVKNYNKTKPIRIEEFDAEKAWWGSEFDGFAARVENERAWKVSIDQIKAANYNLDQKNPHVGEVQDHNPEHLLADYQRLQGEAQALRNELREILAKSLASPR